MTRATNARIAGFTFLAYIAAGITSMVLFRRAASGEGVAAKLAGIAAHTTDVGTHHLLRGRMIPVPLAWLGVFASALLAIGLPLRLAGWLHGPITSLMWLPMLAFEVPLGLWLLTRGVAAEPHASAGVGSA